MGSLCGTLGAIREPFGYALVAFLGYAIRSTGVAFGSILEFLGGVPGGLLGAFGVPWELLGDPWGLLWGLFAAPWAHLGTMWVHFGSIFGNFRLHCGSGGSFLRAGGSCEVILARFRWNFGRLLHGSLSLSLSLSLVLAFSALPSCCFSFVFLVAC